MMSSLVAVIADILLGYTEFLVVIFHSYGDLPF